ncbi:hypothetical protein [Tropicimonas marinistellae]|uniref:hypothetical protein n=1 Tax=Tropicimonas marinistellae TaxID=1739787 RepID=UPI000836B8FF|nr:hypothetical protein [Tropicimonas marinistellae]
MDTMDAAALYDRISLPVLTIQAAALVLLITLPAAAVLGFLSGAMRRKMLLAAGRDVDHVVGETTLGAILALLGLLLAFSFGNALNVSQARKSAIVGEGAALGTAFLRADYLPEPGRTTLQQALLDYGQTRFLPGDGSIHTIEQAQAFIARTLEAQAKLWPLTLEVTADPLPAPLKTFIAGAMNDAIDAHLYRVETLSNPVSDITMSMMLASALMSLFLLGNRAGMVGRKLTWRTFVFSAFLFVVMISILDTQRGTEGLVRMDDTALRVTVFEMEMALASRN